MKHPDPFPWPIKVHVGNVYDCDCEECLACQVWINEAMLMRNDDEPNSLGEPQ